ncbi:MAG: ribosomal-protein-L7/L12-serine acetyltransferase [Alphaproteobacteria bacterium ADurb.Bin438]|nr:MAG: ribosomal-protein-L7/L12-serine acetyltransferase [Alphaproteobacteria bacterium ADurb.Bin438]
MKVVFKNFIHTNEYEKKLILEWRNSDRIRQNMINQDIIIYENHVKWIERLKTKEDAKYYLCIIDDKPVGVYDYTSIEAQHKKAEWGFYVGEEGLGFGVLMEYLGIKHFFEDMKFNRLCAIVLEHNIKTYNIHKNNFLFKDEGFLRDYLIINEKFIGAYLMSMLKREYFEATKNKIEPMINKFYGKIEVLWQD